MKMLHTIMEYLIIFLIPYSLLFLDDVFSAALTLCSRAAAGNESACAPKSAIEFDSEAVKSDGASRRVQHIVMVPMERELPNADCIPAPCFNFFERTVLRRMKILEMLLNNSIFESEKQ